VKSAPQLVDALDDAVAGDVIVVAPGTYRGEFDTREDGTASAPIWLCGEGVILVGTGISGGEVLSFNGASHWRVAGFALTNGQVGLEVKASDDIQVSGLSINAIGDEGVTVKYGSTNTRLSDVTVSDVGLRKAKYGFGVVVTGSSNTTISGLTGDEVPAGMYRINADAIGTVVS
jgi:hypothetical protein